MRIVAARLFVLMLGIASVVPFAAAQDPGPGFLVSGQVTMEDGSAPPEIVAIETVCVGNAWRQTYTDSKGFFVFQGLGERHPPQDASVAGRSGSSAPSASVGIHSRIGMGCDLRVAYLPGYRSDVAVLDGLRYLDAPYVELVLRRVEGAKGSGISSTSAKAPSDARKEFDQGQRANRDRDWKQAEKHLSKAVERYGTYAAAWHELGVAQQGQGKLDQARESFGRALAADPEYLMPHMSLMALGMQERNWREVTEITDRLIRVNAVSDPQVFMANSIAQVNLEAFEAAERSAREALRLDPQHRIPRIEQVLGLALARQQEYAEAAEHLRNYLQLAPRADDTSSVRAQLAEAELRVASIPR